MRIALDSNVLLYWLGLVKKPEDAAKVALAQRIVPTLAVDHDFVMPGQVLGEAYNVLCKSGQPRDRARDSLSPAMRDFEMLPQTTGSYRAALDLAVANKLQFWDALIIQVAGAGGCDLLLSEDMQDGFRVGDLIIADPFAPVIHPRLAALLAE